MQCSGQAQEKQALNWQILWKAVFMYRGYTESTIRYRTNYIKRRCKYISGITFYVSQYIYTHVYKYMCVLLATGTQTCTYTWPENTHTGTTHQLYTLLECSLHVAGVFSISNRAEKHDENVWGWWWVVTKSDLIKTFVLSCARLELMQWWKL